VGIVLEGGRGGSNGETGKGSRSLQGIIIRIFKAEQIADFVSKRIIKFLFFHSVPLWDEIYSEML
jgi:hypothetical protein